MWWIFGLINVVIVFVFAWFYFNEVKEDDEWTRQDKIAIGTLSVLAFLGGLLAFVLLVGLLVYLVIDFIKFIRDKHKK